MPDVGVWKCFPALVEEPDEVLQAALYLTATSTSIEPYEAASTKSTIPVKSEAAAMRPENGDASYRSSPGALGSNTALALAPVPASPSTTSAVAIPGIKYEVESGANSSPPPDTSTDVSAPSKVQTPAKIVDASLKVSIQTSETSTPERLPTMVLASDNAQASSLSPPNRPDDSNVSEKRIPIATVTPTPIDVLSASATSNPQSPLRSPQLAAGTSVAPGPGSSPKHTAPPVFTIGSEPVTAISEYQYVFQGQILTPGGVIIASGTPVSLAPSATEIIVGSSTQALGGLIIGGFGDGSSTSAGVGTVGGTGAGGGYANTTGALVFTGAAERPSSKTGKIIASIIGLMAFFFAL